MKKKCLIITLVFLELCSFAQTNTFPSSGSVGIGTNYPQETLHVNGGQMLNGNLTFASDQTAFFIKAAANGGAIRIRSNGFSTFDRNVQFGNIDNNGTWSSHMIVEQNGLVGIGTVTPSYRLDVADFMRVGAQGGQDYTLIGGGSGVGSEIRMFYADGSENNRLAGNNNSWLAATTGNVGIGTNSPTEKLSVKGKIRAQEVKVENANWPDYVFMKDYQLPTLRETEEHIKENGHLPGIPSAADVKANGINLGEMNAKLLQKIEELTLHLIAKDKELDRERQINSNHEERLRKLELNNQ